MKKVKDLTINEILMYAKRYKGSCTDCPLFAVSEIPCHIYCELSELEQAQIDHAVDRELTDKHVNRILRCYNCAHLVDKKGIWYCNILNQSCYRIKECKYGK